MSPVPRVIASFLPRFACVAGSLIAFAPFVATAQTSGAVLEEVTVSARKRDESASDVPTTLQVFSGDALARDGVRDFSQIQQAVPNFNFFSDRAARAVVSMRGFGATTTTNLAPGVGIFVDGVYQPSTAFFNAPFVDLERLEVLKGPQGTLFGRNAYAGAINIVTRRPNNDVNATAQAEVGNGDTRRAFGSVSGPLVSDRLYGLVSAGFQEQEGFYKYADTGHPAEPNDYVIARGRLVFQATDALSFDLTGQHFDLDTGGFRQHSVNGIGDTTENLALNEPQFEKAKFTDVWLNATWALGAMDLIGITSWSDQRNDSRLDGDFTDSPLIDSVRLNDREIWSQEVRLQSSGQRKFNWLVGVYYSESEILSDQLNSGGFYPTGSLRTLGTEDATIRAVFTDMTLTLTDKLELGAGLRYDDIDKDGQSGNTRFTPGGPVRLSGVSLQGTYRETQPKLSVRYALTDDVNSYVTFSKGFREGGLNLNVPGTDLESFESDEIRNYELGVKGLAGAGLIRFNTSVFFMDAPTYNASGVFANPLGGATLVTRSVGSAESYGIETDATLRLNDIWTIDASLGYIESKWTELRNASSGARVGDALQFTPDWAASLGTRGEIPLGDSGLDLEVAGNVSYRGKTTMSYTANIGPNVRDSYALVDMSVGLVKDGWRAVLFGRNLTDERYPEQFTTAAALASFGATRDVAQFNQPRTYGVRLEYRY